MGHTTITLDLSAAFRLPIDRLLPLLQFNLYRACISNAWTLGIDPRLMHDDIASPFPTASDSYCGSLPLSLRPTRVQKSMPHHPYIDLFPIAEVRDNMIIYDGLFDEDEFCADLAGHTVPSMKDSTGEMGINEQDGPGYTGLVVWGEPWDPAAWELSPYVARKWAWLLQGCDVLFQSTDAWRKMRGERPLAEVL